MSTDKGWPHARAHSGHATHPATHRAPHLAAHRACRRARRRAGRGWGSAGGPLGALALAALAACAVPHTSSLSSLCSDESVVQHVVLVVDSVAPPGGLNVQELRGRRIALTLTLLSDVEQPSPFRSPCPDATGRATWVGAIPGALRTGVGDSTRAAWRIQGDKVRIDLNPGVADNNLEILLPIEGDGGRWGLSTLAGEVASGRVLLDPKR